MAGKAQFSNAKAKNARTDEALKRANIAHHNIEAETYDRAHPELSDIYERVKVAKTLSFLGENSNSTDLCVDLGCGTGFFIGLESSIYKAVLALDISRRMLEFTRERLSHSNQLDLCICDAEFLPLRNETADLVCVGAALHHLPKPFDTISEISRTLKPGGFLYLSREPHSKQSRRYFDFFDEKVVRKFTRLLKHLSIVGSGLRSSRTTVKGLDYSTVDIHVPKGFHITCLTRFLRSKSVEVTSAYSYHWIYPESDEGLWQQLLARSNFAIERIPLAKRFGRCVLIIGRKIGKRDSSIQN